MPALPRDPRGQAVEFTWIASAALPILPALLGRWLPDGRRVGHEWIACNPTRMDRRPGSFKVSLRTGRWADFATGDKGGDAIALAAYLFNVSQLEAARRLAAMLGIQERAR
jgi:hypothetical protein